MITIKSPRPPLNLFEVVRVNATSAWTTIYDVPRYEIPANGPTPLSYIGTAAIPTNLTIANTTSSTIEVGARILDAAGNPFPLLSDLSIPVGDYALLDIERNILKTGEILQVKCGTSQTAAVHFAFILNQREQFEVLP